MMLIARTLRLSPSLISNTTSTRFWSSWTIFGSTRGGEAALAAIELDDPGDVGADLRAGEDLARREPDFGQDLVVLDALVALEDDAVDDRILADRDDQIAGLGAGDHDVGEQLGRVEVLQRLDRASRPYRAGRGEVRVGCGPSPARAAGCRAPQIERIVPCAERQPVAAQLARLARCAGWAGRRWCAELGCAAGSAACATSGRGPAAEDRADQQHGASRAW